MRIVLGLAVAFAVSAQPALGQDPPKSPKEYVKDLASGQPAVRAKAVEMLGYFRHLDALPAILKLLGNDKEVTVRLEAARSAAYFARDSKEAVAALATALTKDASLSVRGAAARAVADLGAELKPIVPALRQALTDKDVLVRVHGARALWNAEKDAQAVLPVLQEGLQDREPEARTWSCFHLIALGPAAKPAVPALRQVLQDKQPRLRVFAAQALWHVTGEPAVLWDLAALLDADADTAALARDAWPTLGEKVVPALTAGLKDKSAARRRQAAQALAAMKALAQPAIPDLIAVLGDPDAAVRAAAVLALTRVGPEVAAPLFQTLDGKDDAVRLGALRALRRTPGLSYKPALATLKTLLKHADPALRVLAAEAIWRVEPDPQLVFPAVTGGQAHPDADVREAAARVLGGVAWLPADESQAAVELLRAAFADKSPEVRRVAVFMVAASKPTPLLNRVKDKVVFQVNEATEHPSLRDPKTLAALVALFNKNDDPATDALLVSVLSRAGQAGKDAVPGLTERLADKSPEVRKNAARALGAIGPDAKNAVAALTKALADEDAGVRQMAAVALAGIGPSAAGAVEALAGRLKDKDALVRLSALIAFTRVGSPAGKSIPTLINYLQTREALPPGKVKDEWLVPQLDGPPRRFVPGGDLVVAIDALGRLADTSEAARAAILPFVTAKDVDQGRAAVEALMRADPKGLPALAKALLKAEPEVREHFLDMLVEREVDAKVALPLLQEALKDGNAEVRQKAVFSLGRLGPAAAAAVPALTALLQDKKNDADLRGTAAQSLGEIGAASKSALPALQAALTDEDAYVRQWSAFALGELGAEAKAALPLLKKLLKDADTGVRKAAGKAIEKIQPPPGPQPAVGPACEAVPRLAAVIARRVA